ncbi:hypothetical protein OE88DRAFT_1653595 [Heliocybe sulcata]|uniref:Uncharacterized protein n=1 Tax=Heliocybe sulcata TaxID=5364 RepID=A0A5C3NBG2_9AGAM|nr:hypothetical protein OE88DRAFT_1653595 [Heliocybe sulcata]
MSSLPLPAHHTKHIPLLDYAFLDRRFSLRQLDDGSSNGTVVGRAVPILVSRGYLCETEAFWYMQQASKSRRIRQRHRAHGVGGTQFPWNATFKTAGDIRRLALSSLGWDILATDVSFVISAVLKDNIHGNVANLTGDPGTIQVRELDWTVPPSNWTWTSHEVISSHTISDVEGHCELLEPPFDLILTSDTLYTESLCTPLLRTLHALCTQSVQSTSRSTRTPPVYICVERRDSALIDRALSEAKSAWGFSVQRVPHRKVLKAMEKGGLAGWNKVDWEGVEIWRMTLR